MVTKSLDELRKLIIISLVSDDKLMEHLVLKGGNAVALVHNLAGRSSLDIDFSLAGDFPNPDVSAMEIVFRKLLIQGFADAGLSVIDVKLEPKPKIVSRDMEHFWGGYRLTFKIIAIGSLEKHKDDDRRLRMVSENAGPMQRKSFKVDFSKHEYCEGKESKDIDGYRVWVYTPAMIVCEKLRAICQQMPEYQNIVKSQSAAQRARDFFDIHILIEKAGVDLTTPHAKGLLRAMFEAKRVPFRLLGEIKIHLEFHRDGFSSVRDTVLPEIPLKDFDYYVEYVIKQVEHLKPFGVE